MVDRWALAWVRSAGRSTDNPNGLKYDRWPVDRQVIWSPTASFWTAYKLGPLARFEQNFGEVLKPIFSSLLELFSTCFWAKTSLSKGEFLKSIYLVFLKEIFRVFHHKIYLVFSHNLGLCIAISIFLDPYCESYFCDQEK